MSKGKRYPEAFKAEAIKQITERGYPVAEVAERLGISTKTLYQWRRDLNHGGQEATTSKEQLEIAQLKAALKRVTEERDILKKAAKYFANNPE